MSKWRQYDLINKALNGDSGVLLLTVTAVVVDFGQVT